MSTEQDDKNSESNVCHDAATKANAVLADNGFLMRAALAYAETHETTVAVKAIFDLREQMTRITRKTY